MTKKLIFFDIDGTLLDSDKELPISTKETIQQLKEKGHYVAIATGRAPFMFKQLREELLIDSFVSFNGQYVVFKDDVVYENPLKIDTLKKLLEYAHESNHPLVFMSEEDMKSSVEDHPFIHESMGSLKFDHPGFHPQYFNEKNIYQTLLFCEEGDEVLYNHYEELRFIRWHKFSTDILPLGGSKAEGMKKIMDRLQFNREDVVAFGDGLNDMEMIQFAGTGVAMGNAVQSLKEVADYVTKPVDEEGIKHAVYELNLL
ncbi:Cof-type HAD-IIB family hydrolase [Bacillus sp. FJAT-47783]|uniref:Cof-type HAD-IIB family hydrolase n=1 Tax=Bacillus sp. FJAT-47783 TaxID=2922712 RepID=UPI001FAD4111|nr:Cof-type HAD-IIB family hydrolase [Bacillus sp. FJAT-47783]